MAFLFAHLSKPPSVLLSGGATPIHDAVGPGVFGSQVMVALHALLASGAVESVKIGRVYRRLFKKSYDMRYLDYICVDQMGVLFRPNYIADHFRWLLEHYQLRKIRFHDLRHSCASLLLAQGIPIKSIQEWLSIRLSPPRRTSIRTWISASGVSLPQPLARLSVGNRSTLNRRARRMNKEHARLLAEYPPVIALDWLYRICHISKRKGHWLLENCVIPCVDTGRNTHRFQVKMADVIAFLERSENGEITLPVGIFSNRRARREEAPLMLDERRFFAYLEREWAALPDALPAREDAELLGYHRTAVNGWAEQGKLPSIHYFGETVFAKEQLMLSWFPLQAAGLWEGHRSIRR